MQLNKEIKLNHTLKIILGFYNYKILKEHFSSFKIWIKYKNLVKFNLFK